MDLTESAIEVTPEALNQMSDLAKQQLGLEDRIAKGEALLKSLKKDLKKVSTDLLPEAMAACGMKTFTLDTGQSISVKEGLSMSAPKAEDKKILCNNWLMEHNQQALLKSEIVLMYDKGEHEKFLSVKALLVDNGIEEFKITEGFNTASVKGVLLELAESGVDVPFEIFGAYQYKKTEIKT